MSLTFTKLTLPAGVETTIAASLVGVEVDKGTRMKMDSEGALHGGRPGKVGLLWDLGMATGIAKITDDSAQLVLELLISSATDASTAGIARYVGAATSALLLATRRGHDVILPQYSEMNVAFTRSVVLSAAQEQSTVNTW